jgi:hypothetical protein
MQHNVRTLVLYMQGEQQQQRAAASDSHLYNNSAYAFSITAADNGSFHTDGHNAGSYITDSYINADEDSFNASNFSGQNFNQLNKPPGSAPDPADVVRQVEVALQARAGKLLLKSSSAPYPMQLQQQQQQQYEQQYEQSFEHSVQSTDTAQEYSQLKNSSNGKEPHIPTLELSAELSAERPVFPGRLRAEVDQLKVHQLAVSPPRSGSSSSSGAYKVPVAAAGSGSKGRGVMHVDTAVGKRKTGVRPGSSGSHARSR